MFHLKHIFAMRCALSGGYCGRGGGYNVVGNMDGGGMTWWALRTKKVSYSI